MEPDGGRAHDLVAAGAVHADSVAAAVTANDVVVVCVLDHGAVHELLDPLGEHLTGHAVVNLTSSAPDQARESARWAAQHHIDYLDGAIMVPTPLVGNPESMLLYSGWQVVYDAHRATLAVLGTGPSSSAPIPGWHRCTTWGCWTCSSPA